MNIKEDIAKLFVHAIRQEPENEVPVWEYLSEAGKQTALKMSDRICDLIATNLPEMSGEEIVNLAREWYLTEDRVKAIVKACWDKLKKELEGE